MEEIKLNDCKISVVDLETTTNGYKDSPKACYTANKILATGSILKGIGSRSYNILVGHNLIFDLAYLMRDKKIDDILNYQIWDTQVAEYLLSGHQFKFPSLEDACNLHKISYSKRIDIGTWLSSGKKMEDIPLEDLTKYVNEDTEATFRLFYFQCLLANSLNLTKHILEVCSIIPAIASMNLNGMKFDISTAKILAGTIQNDLISLHQTITNEIINRYPKFKKHIHKLNITAPRTLSALLYGVPNEIEVGKKVADKIILKFDSPILSTLPSTLTKSGWYSVDDKVLDKIKIPLTDAIREYREKNKILSTYLEPLIEQASFQDGYIFGDLHMTSTATGRLSSSSPNLQNIPEIIRKIFSGEDDTIVVEVDFKQLELVPIAELSKCNQLISDINKGVDVHYETGKSVFGWKMPSDQTIETRRTVKNVVFGLCYGGGASTLSEQSGVSITVVKNIIESFFNRYPEIKVWHLKLLKEVHSNIVRTGSHSNGEVEFVGQYTNSISGRIHKFNQVEVPEFIRSKTGKKYDFSPTQIKNYQAQGFAGGDIMLTFIKVLFHLIEGHDSPLGIKLRNTVHDSVVLTVPKNFSMDQLSNLIEVAKKYVEQFYSLKTNLTCNIKNFGTHWG
jgi:DNA polymerase I-like protein with 3'-5' exonuclease and polymerase domains